MKVLIDPDSLKGTYTATARQVADAIANGVREASGEAIRVPGAHGGQGTLDVPTTALGLRHRTVSTVDPWRAAIIAAFGSVDFWNRGDRGGRRRAISAPMPRTDPAPPWTPLPKKPDSSSLTPSHTGPERMAAESPRPKKSTDPCLHRATHPK